MKILIVEDSKTQSTQLKKILDQHNYYTEIAINGRDALHQLENFHPDLIISDILMPEMNGYELCKCLRSDTRFKNILIILLSSLSDIEDVISALESGANYIITKPYNEAYLLKHLQTAIKINKIRNTELSDQDIKIIINNHVYIINAKKSQIIDFLISVYDSAIIKNKELYNARVELQKFNNKLEDKIAERTAELRKESEEKKRYEKQFYEAQKLESIGQLTGGIAHDFNNLLLVAQGNLELLKIDFEPKSDAIQLLEKAMMAIEKGTELTKHLLSFARKQALFPKSIQVKNSLNNMISLLKPALSDRISISTSYGDDLWPIWVDPIQFENAIMNIVINARDATSKNGNIHFEVVNITVNRNELSQLNDLKGPGDYVKISITDQGEGMSKEVLAHIFEPFFTTKKVGAGTGLGLSMVYGFIKQSNGSISVNSKLGKGTTFTLYLPRSTNVTGPVIENNQYLQYELRGNETILIAEDEESILSLVTAYLKKFGYQIITATNGDEALEIIKSNQKIDLFFSDVIMPGKIKGTELAIEAKKFRPDMKILFTSGYTKDALMSSDLLKINIEHLPKPYKLNILAIKLRQLLDAK